MPFGYSNTAVSLQEYINKIWAKKLIVFVIVHLNNILIYTNEVDHVNAV